MSRARPHGRATAPASTNRRRISATRPVTVSSRARSYRDTEAIDSSLEEFTAAGSREVLVRASDLDAARELLADSRPDAGEGIG
jgi:hypothetical protein